jgi:hypothetical protein
MSSNVLPRAGRRPYFSQYRVSVKKPFAHAIGLDIVVGIFLKNHKNRKEGIAPWVAPSRECLYTGARTLAAQP